MKQMEDWAAVQRVYKQTGSKRETAKVLGIARNTVKKLLDMPLPGIGSFLFSFRFPGLLSSSFIAVGFGFLPAPIRVPSFLIFLGIRKGPCSSHDPLIISSTLFTVYISDFRSAIPPTYHHTFPQLPVRTEPCTCASVLMYHGL